MSLASKIQNLISAANATTGESDTNLTSAVQSLVDGYGGGSVTRYSVAYSLANHVVSSNNATKVAEGNSFTAILSTNDPSYYVGSITVTMGGLNITSTAVEGSRIYIASVTGNVSITATASYFPALVISDTVLNVKGGNTTSFTVKLAGQPAQSQTVALIANGVTLSANTLTFTTSNWNTNQTVTINTSPVDVTSYGYVTVRNSDPLMTDTTVTVVIGSASYEDLVDMTIPAGQHVCTLSDFETSSYQGGTVLDTYIGSYTNIKVPLDLDPNGKLWFNQNCFKGNNIIQYLELPPEIGRLNTAHFESMPALIGLKWHITDIQNVGNFFKNDTSFKWWDGLTLNTGITSMSNFLSPGGTVSDTYAFEYLPDLSAFTKLTTMANAFCGIASLKKVFGLPTAYESSCSMNAAFYGCPQLESLVIGENVTNAASVLRQYSNTNTSTKVYIYEDNLTTSNSGDMFTRNVGPVVYAHKNTDTWTRLSAYVSSGNITLHDIDGGSDVPSIVTWGDSLTSPGTSWTCWPDRLQTKLGASNFVVRNGAVSGDYTTSTSARQGGNTLKTISGFTIPASGSVTIQGSNLGTREGKKFVISGQGADGGTFDPGTTFNPCTISGVSGVISIAGNSVYTFTRTESGSAVNVPAGTYFESDNDDIYNNSDAIMLINLGNNSGWGAVGDGNKTPVASALITQVQYMIDHFEAKGGTKYIVCGPSTSKYVDPDARDYSPAGRAATFEYEELAAVAFGNHWLNLRTYGIQYGLTQNGLTPTAEDTARMENGCWPISLLQGNGDLSHPNAYGANTQMMAFYEKGVALGYWS